MTHKEVREVFFKFFISNNHVKVESSSLIPDDPSVLLTTAGMQQFKPYYTGELNALNDFGSLNTVSIQKSFRTSDIDEVGDDTHSTFFEMMGNFSFGGYEKKLAIELAYTFLSKNLNLKEKISFVSIFEGLDNVGVPKDVESKKIWGEIDSKLDVREESIEDVFWGPTGSSGPCGPTTEIYCRDILNRNIENWNIVFNQYYFDGSRDELISGISNKKLEQLKKFGVDTGMGLERLMMILSNVESIYETDLFLPILEFIPNDMTIKTRRIIADHSRAIVFLLGDGVLPSNKGAGYILRRLMRRIIAHYFLYAKQNKNFNDKDITKPFEAVINNYGEIYKELKNENIIPLFLEERQRFLKVLSQGIKEFDKLKSIDGVSAFHLYESFGLPFEILMDIGGEKTKNLTRIEYENEFKRHQDASRAGKEKKFGGHGMLLDTGELHAANEEERIIVTRLHTATHLLQQALREVLGNTVSQAGSDITADRTRFDFTFMRKLTREEITQVEILVNKKIKEELNMQFVTLPKNEAEKTGALYFFKQKYPDMVNVYFIGDDLKNAWSREFCGGPHVSNTREIGNFKIIKEEAVSSGVRRIRGVINK